MFYLYKENLYICILWLARCAPCPEMLLNVIHHLVVFNMLGLWVSQNVLDGPLDLLGHRWGNRQVSTLWVVSVFVGGVGNGDRGAVRGGVLILTLGDDRGFSLRSDRLRRALLGNGDSVLGLIGVVVGSFGRNVLRLPQNSHWRLLMVVLGHSDGY